MQALQAIQLSGNSASVRTARARILLVCTIFFLTSATVGYAQENALLNLELETPKVRSSAPTPLYWTIRWDGQGILEGHLEFTVLASGEVLGRFTSHDIVATSTDQRLVVMLPALHGSAAAEDIRVRFVGKEGTIDLGDHWTLGLEDRFTRQFSMLVCEEEIVVRQNPQRDFLSSLNLTNYAPPEAQFGGRTPPALQITKLSTIDMPENPLQLCGYDIVAVMDDGFVDLNNRKLKALMQWVEAGGSLCVFGNGPLLAPHLQFLNDLVSADKAAPVFIVGKDGRLPDDPDADPVYLGRKGLGSVAIVRKSLPDDFRVNTPEHRKVVAHLWRIRKDQQGVFLKRGKWVRRIAPQNVGYNPYGRGDEYWNQRDFFSQHIPIQSGGGLVERLMPSDVRVVPLSLIGFLLFLYVMAIGPADFIILGIFRIRRFTWILFPAVTVGFTLFTVWLSHRYMATNQSQGSLIVRDVGSDGKLLRENRFELLFQSTRTTVKTEVKQSLFSPFNHQRFGQSQQMQRSQATTALVGPASYEGTIPTSYTALQEIPQWTPQLNRTFRINAEIPADEQVNLKWDTYRKLVRPSQTRGGPGLNLPGQIKRDLGRRCSICLFDFNSIRNRNWLIHSEVPMFTQDSTGHVEYVQGTTQIGGSYLLPNDFMLDICKRPARTIFSVASMTSPTGGNTFGDIPVLDSTDKNQALLVVVVEADRKLIAYRHRYVFDDQDTETENQ
ncbi:MAG: hypothetical protein CMJ78_16565 [Planctomycetaceae bacterium]|nr:hypothetical protein [Planctomycetaceae bacterium]